MAGGSSILEAVLGVFESIGDWIVSIIPTLLNMFYTADGGLTFLGVLAVAGLGMSVIFLIIGLIQNFLHFRG